MDYNCTTIARNLQQNQYSECWEVRKNPPQIKQNTQTDNQHEHDYSTNYPPRRQSTPPTQEEQNTNRTFPINKTK